MGLGYNLLQGGKKAFRRWSIRKHPVPEQVISKEGLLASSQPPRIGFHPDRENLLVERDRESMQIRVENMVTKERAASTILHFSDGRCTVDETDTIANNRVEKHKQEKTQTPIFNDQRGGPTLVNTTNNPTSLEKPQITMFDKLQNAAISGGTFVQNNTLNSNRRGLELLEKRVATSAFHNSAQRVDPPRCHPDTRVAILQQIYDWITHSEHRDEWLLWLNGAAGAGKSAIIQSIAEHCAQAVIAIATFFFFRADSTRNAMAPLVATLVYQLIQVLPKTADDILSTIERNPLIFDHSLETRLQELLIRPLLQLPQQLQQLFVVFIDGLDECSDRLHQSELIKVLGNVSHTRNTPVIFVISSRREPQIEAAFTDTQISALLKTLPLDNSDVEQTWDDIRRFLMDKFKAIKETHLRRHLLPADWPPVSAIEEITAKSSGQFRRSTRYLISLHIF